MKDLFVTVLVALLSIGVSASDELTRAKELYRSAAYDDALAALDRVPASAASTEAIEVYEYRVFCLVALDRREEAARVMAALVTAAPDYRMSEQQASPRVRTMFADVRRAVLPTLVQRAYEEAKAAFDRQDPGAVTRFDRVLALLTDPDVAAMPGRADLATVATGFRDLSKAQAAAAVAVAPSPAAPVASTSPVITPAVAVSQSIPPMVVREAREWTGEVEIAIDEQGRVASARMSRPIHPIYDAELLRAARKWTYRPALRDGVPTRTIRTVSVHLDSRPPCSGRVTANCRPTDGAR